MSYTDRCPVCDTTEWQYLDTRVEGDFLIHSCACEKCDSLWTEKFVFVENTDIQDGRINA